MAEKRRNLFPALRCSMGSRYYYVTYLTFADVAAWIKPTTEIHDSKKLSDWIQRQLMGKHAAQIASYLKDQNERFFSAIVVGVYGGDPEWAPLDVGRPPDVASYNLTDADTEQLEASVGLLHLSGDESLFAIDGQHRVAGIKQAVQTTPSLRNEEVSAIFVGHQNTAEGLLSTRRLFTTLNKTARRVSDADRVALDEDDGYAVVTRRLIDEFGMLEKGKVIAFAPTASLPPTDERSLTTIISLYGQLKDLYSPSMTDPAIKKSSFARARPSDKAIDQVYNEACAYWQALGRHIPEVKQVFAGKLAAGDLRKHNYNHLLMRPVGQRAFAGAVGVLKSRGLGINRAVQKLAKVDLWIHKKAWHEILWDPIHEVMLKSPLLAETLLLRSANEKGRSAARDRKLTDTLRKRNS